jgi:hypothetical protein
MTRFLFYLRQLRVSWCVAPPLTRGWVCNLLVQLLLGIARAVTHRSKSRRTHDHILLSHMRLPQPGRAGPCIDITQEQGVPVYPRALGSLFVASYDSQGYCGGILTLLDRLLDRSQEEQFLDRAPEEVSWSRYMESSREYRSGQGEAVPEGGERTVVRCGFVKGTVR